MTTGLLAGADVKQVINKETPMSFAKYRCIFLSKKGTVLFKCDVNAISQTAAKLEANKQFKVKRKFGFKTTRGYKVKVIAT